MKVSLMKHQFLFLLFQCCFIVSFAQSGKKDSLLWHLSEMCYYENLDYEGCKEGIRQADSVLKSGDVYLSHAVFHTTIPNTFTYLLEKEYHFKKTDRSNRTVTDCCFIKAIKQKTLERHGDDFWVLLNAKADSLDSIGMGYKCALMTDDDKTIYDYTFCKLKEEKELPEFIDFSISCIVDRSGKLKIKEIRGQEEEEKNYVQKTLKVLKYMPKLQPATIRGKAVESEYILLINYYLLEQWKNCP